MLERMRAHQQHHHQLQHQNQALPRPLPSPSGFMGGGLWTDARTDGRRHLPTSRPWFYPVVEQHDVTYHRVKPLTWHRRQRHNAKPNRKNENTANRKITTYTERRPGTQQTKGAGWIHVMSGWRDEVRKGTCNVARRQEVLCGFSRQHLKGAWSNLQYALCWQPVKNSSSHTNLRHANVPSDKTSYATIRILQEWRAVKVSNLNTLSQESCYAPCPLLL